MLNSVGLKVPTRMLVSLMVGIKLPVGSVIRTKLELLLFQGARLFVIRLRYVIYQSN